MARNRTWIDAPPEAVWRVLADPWAYPRWVVGADRTVSASADWPALDASFRVHIAAGYVDVTEVREVDVGRRLVLHAAKGVMGPARITIEIEADGSGTKLTMVEDPAGKLAPLRWAPIVQVAIKLRNVESLRRLRRVAERRAQQGTFAT